MENTELNDLPAMQDEYELTPQQIASYQHDGHIVLRDIASQEEIKAYRTVINDLVKELNNQTKPMDQRDTYGKAFIQIDNLWEKSEAVRRFVLARRFAKIAADLMGVDGVRIYHDQALFKEPGGGHTPWHQDQIYFPLETPHVITMWMPLVPISAEVGSMTFASTSHKLGYVSKVVISDESHVTLKDYIKKKGLQTVDYGALDAGDATFHAGWTLHCAPGNPTEQMREVMTVIYMADGTRIAEPDSKVRKADLELYFPGLNPGDLAAGHLCPLVYKS